MEILLLLIPLGYIVFAVWAVWKIVGQATTKRRKQWLGGGAALIFLLVPTADEAWNRLQVVRLCHKDAGYHSHEAMKHVSGFYDSTMQFRAHDARQLGFDYVETPAQVFPHRSGFVRRTLDESGKEVIAPIPEPSSMFEYGIIVGPAIGAVTRLEYYLRSRATGRPLSTFVTYSYERGWAIRFLFGGMAYGGFGCAALTKQTFSSSRFILAALSPSPERQ